MHKPAILTYVDDGDVFAGGPWFEIFPGNPQPHLVEERRVEARGHVRIDGKHSEVAKHRPGDDHPASADAASSTGCVLLALRRRAFDHGWRLCSVASLHRSALHTHAARNRFGVCCKRPTADIFVDFSARLARGMMRVRSARAPHPT